ncbi:MAG: hypothetical protein M1830_002949, partial [Pleopsidium flavum]
MSGEVAMTSPDRPQVAILDARPHPLDQLTVNETKVARETVLNARGNSIIEFRAIALEEPPKAEVLAFLDAEHSGSLSSKTERPTRLARVQYDVVHADKSHEYTESVVDIEARWETLHRVVDKMHQPSLTMDEFRVFQDACVASPLFKEAIANFKLPEGFNITIDPWPYGGPDP